MPIQKQLLKKFAALTGLFIVLCSPAFAQDNIKTGIDVSWKTGEIIVTAEVMIPETDDNLIPARFRISESIDRNLTEIITAALDSLYLNSLSTVSESLQSNMNKMIKFDELNNSKTRVSSSLSLDLKSITNIYRYNIYTDIIPVVIEHEKPKPVPAVFDYEPTAAFSGIVIYAGDEMPLYGENDTGSISPAIFPNIYDSNMDLVASPEMTEPEFLKKWGFAAYSDKLDEKLFEERIGLYPYHTVAEGIFGNNRTDIIIPEEAAAKILYNEDNHRLLREGRILIIYTP